MRSGIFIIICAVLFSGNAIAVPPGKKVEFEGGLLGKVIFDGKIHFEKGMKCIDCHMKVFKMKRRETKIKMAEIYSGKYCGVCHNGEKAFSSSEASNCIRCHRK